MSSATVLLCSTYHTQLAGNHILAASRYCTGHLATKSLEVLRASSEDVSHTRVKKGTISSPAFQTYIGNSLANRYPLHSPKTRLGFPLTSRFSRSPDFHPISGADHRRGLHINASKPRRISRPPGPPPRRRRGAMTSDNHSLPPFDQGGSKPGSSSRQGPVPGRVNTATGSKHALSSHQSTGYHPAFPPLPRSDPNTGSSRRSVTPPFRTNSVKPPTHGPPSRSDRSKSPPLSKSKQRDVRAASGSSHFRDSNNEVGSATSPTRPHSSRPPPSHAKPQTTRESSSRMAEINGRLNAKFTPLLPHAQKAPPPPFRGDAASQVPTGRRSPAMGQPRVPFKYIKPVHMDFIQQVREVIERVERDEEINKPPLTLPADSVQAAQRAEQVHLRHIRGQTLTRVNAVIRRFYGPTYHVELFGSAYYGVSSAMSDLDLVIVDSERMDGFPPDAVDFLPPIYNVRELAKKFIKCGFKQVRAIPKAAVPIVKVKDPHTGLECDINVNDQLGLVNSRMLKTYCDISTLLRPMLKLIKAWAKPLGLNKPSGPGGPRSFSSYALSLMTIGFLQTKGLLPNLQADISPPTPDETYPMDIFWVRRRKLRMKCDLRWRHHPGPYPAVGNVQDLMIEWFHYWADAFDYEEDMISIREGGVVPRPIVGPPWKTPAELKKERMMKEGKGKEKEGSESDQAHDLQDLVGPETDSQEPIEEESEATSETLEALEELPQDVAKGLQVENNVVQADEWSQNHFVVVDPFVRRQNVVGGIKLTSMRHFREQCRRAVKLMEGGKTIEEVIEGLEPVVMQLGKKKKVKGKDGQQGAKNPTQLSA